MSRDSVLLDTSGELGDYDIAGSLRTAVLCEQTSAADGDAHVVKKRERIFGGLNSA